MVTKKVSSDPLPEPTKLPYVTRTGTAGDFRAPHNPPDAFKTVRSLYQTDLAKLLEAILDGGNLTVSPLTPAQTAAIANATAISQGLVDAITGKPAGTGTLADAVAALAALAQEPRFQSLLDAAAGRPNATVAQALTALQKPGADLKAFLDGIVRKPNATTAEAVAVFENLERGNVYVGDSLNDLVWGLAKKNPASVADAVTAVYAAVGLKADQATVKALVDGLASKPNATVAEAVAAVLALGGGTDPATVDALIGTALAATILPILEGHTAEIAGVDTALKATQTLVANLVNEITNLSGGGAGEPLAQQLIDILGGKPQGGGTIADVAATFAALGQALMGAVGIEEAAVNALIAAAIADLDLSLDEAAVVALLEQQLAALGPMIVMAVQSQMTAMPDRIRLNVTDASAGAKVVIEALNLTATNAIPNPVSMDIEVPGGTLSVNGKRVAMTEDVELFTGLVENLHGQITGGVEQINGATGEPINHAIVVGNWLLQLADLIADVETNVMAFGDNVTLLSATKADQAEFLALKAAVAALGGGGGAGLTGEQAQLLASTAADLGALITGITAIFTTSPTPEGAVNAIRRITKDAETGSKIASAFLGGFLGKPLNQLGSTEQEALQAIVDYGVGLNRTIVGQASSITGILTDLDTTNTNILELAEAVVPLRDTVELHGDRITTLEGAALGGGEGVSQAVVDSLLARLDALEAENVTLRGEITRLDQLIYDNTIALQSDTQTLALTVGGLPSYNFVTAELAKKVDKTAFDQYKDGINTWAQYTNEQIAELQGGGAGDLSGIESAIAALQVDKADALALVVAQNTVQEFLDNLALAVTTLQNDKADKTALANLITTTTLNSTVVHLENKINDLVGQILEYVIENYAEKSYVENIEGASIDIYGKLATDVADLSKRVQDFMDALNGPNATVQGITEMFWLLSDIITALMEATGVELPGRAAAIGSGQ